MVVIEANLPHIVKLLLGYKRIKLDVKNKQGDSLMHLCIDSRETVSLFVQSVCVLRYNFVCRFKLLDAKYSSTFKEP